MTTLYLKYRPDDFDQLYGNDNLKEYWKRMEVNKIPHTILFHGPTGCGKTTTARIVAKKLGCSGGDLREIDAADFRGIDTIREIRKQSQFSPLESSCRVWILDEAHQLGSTAQPALLKILEDTPKHVYFILCTTDPQKLLATIRGRCDAHQVQPLNRVQMLKLLMSVVKKEGEVVEKVVLEQIIQDGMGLPRNSLQILNQVLSVPEEHRLETAKKAAEKQSQSIELCRALLENASWKKVSRILSELQDDPEGIRRHVLGYCNSIMLKGDNKQAIVVMEQFEEPTYNIGMPGITLACYRCIN